jgi:hypothetical protein
MSKLSPEQWDIICYVEEYWRTNGSFPSEGDIGNELGFSTAKVKENLYTELVKKHITVRGIDWDKDTPDSSPSSQRRTGKTRRLSDIQLAVANTLLNPMDRRPVSAKLEALGVTTATYAGWKKSSTFMRYMEAQSEMLYGEYTPDVSAKLTSLAAAGDMKAIKLFMEVSGRWRGTQSGETDNVKLVVVRLVEVIQKHVKDPLILQAIAEDIQAITNPASINVKPVRGEIVGEHA